MEVKVKRKFKPNSSLLFFNFNNFFKFAGNFPDLFITRNSIAHIFFLFKLAQSTRKIFFNFYCTTCFLKGITMRYWRRRFNMYWDWNFIFFPSYHYNHLYYFEYLVNDMSPQQFSYDTFYYGLKDPYRVISYEKFFLKVNFHLFMVAWKSIAYLRATCYSHYARSHFFINHPDYRHSRFALTQGWARYFDRERRVLTFRQLSLRFILGVYKMKYHIYRLDFAKPVFDTPFPQLSVTAAFPRKNNFIRFLMGIARIPTRFFKSMPIFRGGIHQWVGLIANSIISRYTNHFTQYTRFDYEHASILFKVLGHTPFGRNRLLSMWLAEWKDSLFEHFYEESNFCRLFMVLDFLLVKTKTANDYQLKPLFPWIRAPRFLFTYRVNKLDINDSFDVNFFTNFNRGRCLDGHNPIMGDSWHVYKQFWSDYLIRYNYFGNFHYIDRRLTTNPIHRLYYQWRIFNISPVYSFLDGRLPLRFFYRKLESDYVMSFKYKWLWTVFREKLFTRIFHTFCKPRFKFRKKFDDRRFLMTPFPVAHIVRAGLKKWYLRNGHKLPKPKVSLKLTSFVGFSMIASVFVLVFFKSLGLSFITFFTLWGSRHSICCTNWSYWQSETLTLLYINQWAVRQWISNYRVKWPHYRRKISKSGIHSLTNPFFRENWMRVFHKSRRAGFKRHELPYYCYDESLDLIKHLFSLISASDNTTIFYIPGILLIDETSPGSSVSTFDSINYC